MEHVLENGICATCRPHVLRNGRCVTCRTTASRHFDIHQPRDPHNGKWITTGGVLGALLPNDANLFDSEKDWDRYESHYKVVDEFTVGGFTAVSTALGEGQVAFDDGSHRYVLGDTDGDGLRDLADTIDKLVEEYETADGLEAADNGLLDYLPWGEDQELVVGFDAAGDFRFTAKDADGKTFDLPELSVEDAAKFADGLREQADTADEQLEE